MNEASMVYGRRSKSDALRDPAGGHLRVHDCNAIEPGCTQASHRRRDCGDARPRSRYGRHPAAPR